MGPTSQKCQLWMKSTERLSCQRLLSPVKYVCYLYATSYEGIQTSAVIPAICLTGLHLLHLCMEYWLLYFLHDIKDIQALIFMCVCTWMCVCLEWYCCHLWEWPMLSMCLYSMFIANAYINLKANKFIAKRGKKSQKPCTHNTFKMKQCRLS